MQPSRPASASIHLWLAAVLIAGAALRFHDLGGPSTWVDELCRIVWAKGYEFDRWFGFLPSETGARMQARDVGEALRVVNAHNPPLYSILLNAWMRLVGSESDLALRIPSALLGVLSILGTFLAGRRLLGQAVGAWAATLVALSPFHVFYAQEVNHYALAACLVSFALWFHFRWLERPGVASGVGVAVTGLAALYTHYYAGIVLAFQVVELAVRHRHAPRRLALDALPYLAIAAGFAPYLATLRAQLRELTDPSMVGTFRGARYFGERLLALPVVPWLGERGEHLAPLLALPVAALTIGLFVAGVRSIADGAVRRVLLLQALGPLAFVVVFFWVSGSNSILWSRYQLFFTFAQLLPVAVALHGPPRWGRLAAPALAVLAVVGFRFMFVDLVKEDWEGAAAAIGSRGSGDERVLVYRPNLAYALGRYLPSDDHRLFGVEGGASLPAQLAAAADGEEAVWFVSAWADDADLLATVHALLSCRYAAREDLPIRSGRVGLAVTRYSERREREASPPVVERVGASTCSPAALGRDLFDWENPAAGPALQAGMFDAPTPLEEVRASSLTVTGWAFSTRGIRALVFELDGREALRVRHVGLRRPDVAGAYPAAAVSHTLHSGYWGVVDLSAVEPGTHSVSVSAVHPDGTRHRFGEREFRLLGGAPAAAQRAR